MRPADLGLKTKIMAGGLIPVVLVLFLSMADVLSVRWLLDSLYSVDRSHKAVRLALGIQEDALNMETGMRGFLLTGQESFLEPYKSGQKDIGRKLVTLEGMVKDDPKQVELLSEIGKIVKTWTTESAVPAIALRREIGQGKGMDDLAAFVAQETGKSYLDKFRVLVDSFMDREQSISDDMKNEGLNAKDNETAAKAFEALDRHQVIVTQAWSILVSAVNMEAAVQSYLLAGKESFLDPYNVGKQGLFVLVAQQKKLIKGDTSQEKLLDDMEQTMTEWVKRVAEPQISLRRQILNAKTMVDLRDWLAKGEDKKQFDRFRELMAEFTGREDAQLTTGQSVARQTSVRVQRVQIIGTVLIVLAALVLLYLVAGAITGPVAAAAALATDISTGDLSRNLGIKSRDEVGRLGSALNDMVANLREQTRRTSEGVSVLSSLSAEIGAAVTELARSSSQVSSAVTETATTVEQVRQSGRLANERATKVAESARVAMQMSETGRKAAEETIQRIQAVSQEMNYIGETVVKLSEHGQAIEQIIGVVQDLADQSKLLAVNASIEAARAGDQGKGFSVVAAEIKSLADQSKVATEQVRMILEDNRKWVSAVVMATEQGSRAVEAGVRQSELAGGSIRGLAESMSDSSQAAMVISSSVEQQFSGVDQVSGAMTSIEQAIRQNLASTQHLEGAARRLEELGGGLQELVQRYRVS